MSNVSETLIGMAEMFSQIARYTTGGQRAGSPTHLQMSCHLRPSQRREVVEWSDMLLAMAAKVEETETERDMWKRRFKAEVAALDDRLENS